MTRFEKVKHQVDKLKRYDIDKIQKSCDKNFKKFYLLWLMKRNKNGE